MFLLQTTCSINLTWVVMLHYNTQINKGWPIEIVNIDLVLDMILFEPTFEVSFSKFVTWWSWYWYDDLRWNIKCASDDLYGEKNINSTKVIVFMNYGFGLFLLLPKIFVDEVNNTQVCGSQGLVWNENIVYIECLIRISVYLFCLYWF